MSTNHTIHKKRTASASNLGNGLNKIIAGRITQDPKPITAVINYKS